MEDENKELKSKIATLEKEVYRLRGLNTTAEKIWMNVAKFGGLLLMLLPFLPNAFFYLGMADAKTRVEGSDYWYVIGGAILFFAQKYVGELLNALGKKLIEKLS